MTPNKYMYGDNKNSTSVALGANITYTGEAVEMVYSSIIVACKTDAAAIATRFEVLRLLIDTSVDNFVQINEPIGFNFSPTDVFYLVADTDTNGTVVNARFSINEYQRT